MSIMPFAAEGGCGATRIYTQAMCAAADGKCKAYSLSQQSNWTA